MFVLIVPVMDRRYLLLRLLLLLVLMLLLLSHPVRCSHSVGLVVFVILFVCLIFVFVYSRVLFLFVFRVREIVVL